MPEFRGIILPMGRDEGVTGRNLIRAQLQQIRGYHGIHGYRRNIPGEENPASVLTKTLGHRPLYKLTKRFIFYGKENCPVLEEKGKPDSHNPT